MNPFIIVAIPLALVILGLVLNSIGGARVTLVEVRIADSL